MAEMDETRLEELRPYVYESFDNYRNTDPGLFGLKGIRKELEMIHRDMKKYNTKIVIENSLVRRQRHHDVRGFHMALLGVMSLAFWGNRFLFPEGAFSFLLTIAGYLALLSGVLWALETFLCDKGMGLINEAFFKMPNWRTEDENQQQQPSPTKEM